MLLDDQRLPAHVSRYRRAGAHGRPSASLIVRGTSRLVVTRGASSRLLDLIRLAAGAHLPVTEDPVFDESARATSPPPHWVILNVTEFLVAPWIWRQMF